MPTVNIYLHSNIEEENNLGVIYLHCTSVSKVLMKKTALFYLLLSVLIAQLPQFLNTREGKNDFSEKKNYLKMRTFCPLEVTVKEITKSHFNWEQYV